MDSPLETPTPSAADHASNTTPGTSSSVDAQLTELLGGLKKAQEDVKAQADALEALRQAAVEQHRKGGPLVPGNAPHARRGEDPLSSRGYSFMKLFGLLSGQLEANNAKVEIDYARKLQGLYVDQLGYVKAKPNSIMAPFATSLLSEIPGQEGFARELGEVVRAGITGYDPEQVRALRIQNWGYQKALSWLDETTGGALVAPPIMGELIELLRNNEVLMQAGARVLPLPPNGRIVYPRQTSAGTAYWVGESQTITDSTPGTGDVVLQAKKLAVINKIPNELFRFSSVSVEMFVREDISRVMALKLDKSLLEGVGSQYEPKGLINYANIVSHTAGETAADGDTFTPEDVIEMVAKVEERNAIFRAFVMRPLMYGAILNRRADAVSSGDAAGPFVFNMFRGVGENLDPTRLGVGNLLQYPVYKSTQISQARTKGSASNLTYILGGDFTDYLIALSGAMEFMVSVQGDTPFQGDQTWIRGVTLCDGAPRHEASFSICDSVVVG